METPKALPETRNCCIQSCINSKETTLDKFQFFKPPMEKHILDKWKEAISQHQDTKNITFVCNLHFEPKSMIKIGEKMLLKRDTIPSIFSKTDLTQTTSAFNDESTKLVKNEQMNEIGSTTCNGCHERDAQIQNLLEQIRYWKSLAQAKTELNIELIKVEELQLDQMDFEDEDVICKSEIIDLETCGKLAKVGNNEDIVISLNKQDTKKDVLLKPFTCARCNESFRTAQELKHHMSSLCIYSKKIQRKRRTWMPISRPYNYECYICKNLYDSLPMIYQHMKVHTEPKCHICGYDGNQLDQHLCVEEKYISCEYCSQQYSSTKELLEHLDSVHSEKKMHKCGRCLESFRMVHLIRIHHMQIHGMTRVFRCDKCRKVYATQDRLIRHQRREHKQEKHEEAEIPKLYSCDLCPKSFGLERSLLTHQTMAHIIGKRKTNLVCDQCGKEFKDSSALWGHKPIHREPKYKCPDCPQAFRIKTHLTRHSYVHRNETFVCSICGTEHRSPRGLKAHMESQHNPNAKLIECKICSKTVKDKKTMDNHMKTHTSIRAFQCTYCDSAFKRGGDLNKHLRIHLGDRIYTCTEPECSERFRLPIELRKHSFKHYKEQQSNKMDTKEA